LAIVCIDACRLSFRYVSHNFNYCFFIVKFQRRRIGNQNDESRIGCGNNFYKHKSSPKHQTNQFIALGVCTIDITWQLYGHQNQRRFDNVAVESLSRRISTSINWTIVQCFCFVIVVDVVDNKQFYSAFLPASSKPLNCKLFKQYTTTNIHVTLYSSYRCRSIARE
jgi:hypothetical protein